ncbi:hypothetical protein B0H14DRAFT_3430775 [Mycena olivaceomarginata]|nr:hypothetical protein B0H14DRAFT_3430775 [Mycena olivaceomarginata]
MLRNWPWPRSISAFYDEVKKESSEWCESFKAFSPKVQDVFNFTEFGDLSEKLLITCIYELNEMVQYSSSSTDTDVANGTTARYQMDCVMDALWDPSKPRPDDEWVGGAIHLDIPDEVMENPALKELTTVIIDMLIVHNDLCSYNVEQARGDVDHNLITIFDQLTEKFWEAWDRIPTYNGPLDLQVRIYTDGLGNWVRGYDQWSFESEQYFGKDGRIFSAAARLSFSLNGRRLKNDCGYNARSK